MSDDNQQYPAITSSNSTVWAKHPQVNGHSTVAPAAVINQQGRRHYDYIGQKLLMGITWWLINRCLMVEWVNDGR